MKKIAKAFALILTVLIINSCSSDGNGGPDIYQKWYCTEVIQNGISQEYNSNSCSGFYIEFYDFTKYRVVNIENCQEQLTAQGTFTREGNIITVNGINAITNNPFTDTYDITELTQHNLTMNSHDDYYESETGELLPALVLKYSL